MMLRDIMKHKFFHHDYFIFWTNIITDPFIGMSIFYWNVYLLLEW